MKDPYNNAPPSPPPVHTANRHHNHNKNILNICDIKFYALLKLNFLVITQCKVSSIACYLECWLPTHACISLLFKSVVDIKLGYDFI